MPINVKEITVVGGVVSPKMVKCGGEIIDKLLREYGFTLAECNSILVHLIISLDKTISEMEPIIGKETVN